MELGEVFLDGIDRERDGGATRFLEGTERLTSCDREVVRRGGA